MLLLKDRLQDSTMTLWINQSIKHLTLQSISQPFNHSTMEAETHLISQAAYTKTNHLWLTFSWLKNCCLASPRSVVARCPLSRPQPLGPPRFRAVSDRAWWPSQVPGDSAGSVRPKSHDAAHLGPGWISPWKKRPGYPWSLTSHPKPFKGAPKLVFSVVMKFDQLCMEYLSIHEWLEFYCKLLAGGFNPFEKY